ncbi:MAG: LemA family protein [Gammaproteobacteria bacterium]|nr:LemA family protein [Gammaproteobacteria bacterium]
MAQRDDDKAREERIARLQADGVLSAKQAQLLCTSLQVGTAGTGSKTSSHAGSKRKPWTIYFILICLATIIAWLMTGIGNETAIQDVSQTLNQPGETGAMNNSLSNLIAVFLILAIPVGLLAWFYNAIISREEAVYGSWAQVESSYQRRNDLIPALIDTVSRYLNHEADTLTRVTESRSAGAAEFDTLLQDLLQAQADSAELLGQGETLLDEAESLTALQQAQNLVGGRMMRLFALVEDYPDLNSSDQFLELQGQLEGTENRINVARVRFNEAVEEYNQSIRRLPGNLIAGLGGFQRKAYFQADEGADNAPDLNFE